MRDIILFTGVTSVGKTVAIQYFIQYAVQRNIPCYKEPISDAQSILQAVKEDDKQGGFHHTHGWTKGKNKGHLHDIHKDILPFVATDTVIPRRMQELFFAHLANSTRKHQCIFVEWSGGVNAYSAHHILHTVDFSYTTTYKRLQKKAFARTWMKRVCGIVHIQANWKTRLFLNSITSILKDSGVMNGKKGWKRMPEVLSLFGKDDFVSSGFIKDSALKGVHRYMIYNDGTEKYFEALNCIASSILKKNAIS